MKKNSILGQNKKCLIFVIKNVLNACIIAKIINKLNILFIKKIEIITEYKIYKYLYILYNIT